MAVRQLPGGAAPRARRQRARAGRHGPDVLEPRRALQRHRSAGRRALLDAPARPHRSAPDVPRAGLLRLRPAGVPPSPGDVLCGRDRLCGASARRAARGRRSRPTRSSALLERSAADQTPATGCRRCTSSATRMTRLGSARRHARPIQWPGATAGSDRYETNDDAGARARRVRARAALRSRASTTGTTRTTSTPSGLRKGAAAACRALTALAGTDVDLRRSGTPGRDGSIDLRSRAASSPSLAAGPGANERLTYRAPTAGPLLRAGEDLGPGAGGYQLQLFRQQLLVGHVADLPRRIPDDDRARRNVVDDDSTGADERLLADLDPGEQAPRRRRSRAPRRIVGPRRSAWRRSVRPMKLSFVVTTQGAMKTSSSSVE